MSSGTQSRKLQASILALQHTGKVITYNTSIWIYMYWHLIYFFRSRLLLSFGWFLFFMRQNKNRSIFCVVPTNLSNIFVRWICEVLIKSFPIQVTSLFYTSRWSSVSSSITASIAWFRTPSMHGRARRSWNTSSWATLQYASKKKTMSWLHDGEQSNMGVCLLTFETAPCLQLPSSDSEFIGLDLDLMPLFQDLMKKPWPITSGQL